MTQSGQGEEPSAQPAREGIVLPSDGHAAPAGGQAWGGSWGPEQPAQTPPAQNWGADTAQSWGAPGAQPSWQPSDAQSGWGQASAPQPQAAPGRPLTPQAPAGSGAGPLPPEAAPTSSYGANGQPAPRGAHSVPHAAPLPSAADEGATQYIPPVVPDEGATQYIPPVAPGALPEEVPADDATHFLGQSAGPARHGGGMPPAVNPDAEATQYLSPVPGGPAPAPYGMPSDAADGGWQTPSEFDNLFRSDEGGAASTQQMPRFDVADEPGAPVGRAAGRRAGGGGRPPSRVPLIAAVGVGIAVVGIGAGALMGAGGDSGSKGVDNQTVAATGPAAEPSQSESASAPADQAKEQAVALDKLLADSGNSRGAVIKAVADVRACQNLDQAATDLGNAAKQRNDLVTRLSGLSVDKLPNHGQLTAALNSAWKASASADSHYAAWANQVSHKKGCKKGHARSTSQTAAGDEASRTASAQKAKAAPLWNAIAQKYGLTQRQPTQL
ncbi:hypothetical protein [Streptomyces colonosanans]|uniref:Uncharacterized protein n=1 Tax=Streptomyces colonosanans TaxID=1428652 RepID=A0A1S2PG82_9ACTN|nr:hypothetical protein [Streptomyces colonosanans]OIJ92829.1 hypothetical protein BIV24_12890 [Streptomyces colonosanans]